MEPSPEHLKQLRRLTQTLLVSGCLNVLLLTLFFYFLSREVSPKPYFELKPADKAEQQPPIAVDSSNKEMIRHFRELSLEQLIVKLDDQRLVENGYRYRDLALASLIAFHHFDLQRAFVGNIPTQKRKMPFGVNQNGQQVRIDIYPELSDDQYKTIIEFAKREKWPLTNRGIFLLLRKHGKNFDTVLSELFFLSPEFTSVNMLFSRSGAQVSKEELFDLLLQGNWKLLSTFSEQQKKVQDLSPTRRQLFLLDYITLHSPIAASLILRTDGLFAAKKLDDAHVIAILNLLKEKNDLSEKFAKIILTSPRGDAVRLKAAETLYHLAGEPIPDKDLHLAALARFIPQASSIVAPAKSANKTKKVNPIVTKPAKPLSKTKEKQIAVAAAEKPKTYTVQSGDSLWKISRKFKVDVGALKKRNNLTSDFLKPGLILYIP